MVQYMSCGNQSTAYCWILKPDNAEASRQIPVRSEVLLIHILACLIEEGPLSLRLVSTWRSLFAYSLTSQLSQHTMPSALIIIISPSPVLFQCHLPHAPNGFSMLSAKCRW